MSGKKKRRQNRQSAGGAESGAPAVPQLDTSYHIFALSLQTPVILGRIVPELDILNRPPFEGRAYCCWYTAMLATYSVVLNVGDDPQTIAVITAEFEALAAQPNVSNPEARAELPALFRDLHDGWARRALLDKPEEAIEFSARWVLDQWASTPGATEEDIQVLRGDLAAIAVEAFLGHSLRPDRPFDARIDHAWARLIETGEVDDPRNPNVDPLDGYAAAVSLCAVEIGMEVARELLEAGFEEIEDELEGDEDGSQR